MKYTIEGFDQKTALTFKRDELVNGHTRTVRLDVTDLVILRWFVDFYPNMKKKAIEGREYALLQHSYLASEMPLLGISRKACIARMQKLVSFGILDYRLIKQGGTWSYYTFGSEYERLVNSKGVTLQTTTGVRSNDQGGVRSNDHPVAVQTTNKDSSIKDSSIKNKNKLSVETDSSVKEIIDYLNEKSGKTFKPTTKETRSLIQARLNEGFTLDDFKEVIDKKVSEWGGDAQMEQYIRPSTLFGTKFEAYKNQKGRGTQMRSGIHAQKYATADPGDVFSALREAGIA